MVPASEPYNPKEGNTMGDKRSMVHLTTEDGQDWLADPDRITEIVGDDDGATVYYATQGSNGTTSIGARRVRDQLEHVDGLFNVQKSTRKLDERDEQRRQNREAKDKAQQAQRQPTSATPGIHAHAGMPNPNRGNTAATGGIDKPGQGLEEGDPGPDVPRSDHMPPGAMAASRGGPDKTDKDRGVQK